MGSPAPLLLTFASYLLFVLSVGPRYMKDRKPMKLSFFIRSYNVFQVCACIYFINWGRKRGINFSSTWQCLENRKDAGERLELDQISWLFMQLRLIELVETVIFVLRKKQNQVSSLHIYHHLSTVVLLWSFLKYSSSECENLWNFKNFHCRSKRFCVIKCEENSNRFFTLVWWQRFSRQDEGSSQAKRQVFRR